VVDPWLVLAAAVIEGLIGYPDALHRVFPHPVVWLGRMVGGFDKVWNDQSAPTGQRRFLGMLALVLTAGLVGLIGFVLQQRVAFWAIPAIGAFGLAARSLHDHVHTVLNALTANNLSAAQAYVGRIVGRDTHSLDEEGVASAALESLAESFNDGVVAPLFWFLVGGLAGLFIYKAVNTADSMVGHMEPRWRAFGWASAKTDDLMNWIPARIAGGLIAIVAGSGFSVMLRDARKHASPNSGWPEAAMAGALGIRLGGPAT
jgi:adenosylcobinamide-phosphate synthase